jgi:hypothetical protein
MLVFQVLVFALLVIFELDAKRNGFIYKSKLPNKVKLVQFQSRHGGKNNQFSKF